MPVAQTTQMERQIWKWLPARADRGRVTGPATIAVALAVPVTDVTAALEAMERAGHAIRNHRTGRRANSWHRGLPYPEPVAPAPQGLW